MRFKKLVAVNNPREHTLKKVQETLQNTDRPMSRWALREATGTNWDSIDACLDILIERGLVREIVTSNGVYYRWTGDSE